MVKVMHPCYDPLLGPVLTCDAVLCCAAYCPSPAQLASYKVTVVLVEPNAHGAVLTRRAMCAVLPAAPLLHSLPPTRLL